MFLKFFLLFLIFFISFSQLKFKNGKFKILQFTDLHYGSNSFWDQSSFVQQENLLDWEKPDFVAITGDAVNGNVDRDFETSYKWLIEPMLKRKIPFSYTNGNHDVGELIYLKSRG